LWPLTEWRKAPMIVAKMISSVKRRIKLRSQISA
jgi:hypothetical protein